MQQTILPVKPERNTIKIFSTSIYSTVELKHWLKMVT